MRFLFCKLFASMVSQRMSATWFFHGVFGDLSFRLRVEIVDQRRLMQASHSYHYFLDLHGAVNNGWTGVHLYVGVMRLHMVVKCLE